MLKTSLVVTLIILIILAGVSISMIVGDNGIITEAKKQPNAPEKIDGMTSITFIEPIETKGKIGLDSTYFHLENL